MRLAVGSWWLVVVLMVAPLRAVAARNEVLVSAAASLTDVMQQVARAYEARTGVRVVLNTGASNTLARQIAAGAPVDVFISADAAQMDVVNEHIAPGTRSDLLSNRLAIAVSADGSLSVRSARDLTAPAFARIAIGDPAAVPAGVYAKAYLEHLGIWETVEKRIIPTGSVRLALAAVENGAAEAAIVYRTDIATTHGVRLALAISADDGPRIAYPAAVMRRAPNPEGAQRFVMWLRGSESMAIFQAAGFLPPPQSRKAG